MADIGGSKVVIQALKTASNRNIISSPFLLGDLLEEVTRLEESCVQALREEKELGEKKRLKMMRRNFNLTPLSLGVNKCCEWRRLIDWRTERKKKK